VQRNLPGIVAVRSNSADAMRSPAFDLRRMTAWVPDVGPSVRAALRWGAHHTGLPVVVFSAIALVAAWHLLRRTARFAIEVVLAVVLLLVAAKLGWIAW